MITLVFRCVNRDKSFPPSLLFNLLFSHCHVGNTHSEPRCCFQTRTKRLLKSFFHAADVYVISLRRCGIFLLIRAQTFTPANTGLYTAQKTLANKNSCERSLPTQNRKIRLCAFFFSFSEYNTENAEDWISACFILHVLTGFAQRNKILWKLSFSSSL